MPAQKAPQTLLLAAEFEPAKPRAPQLEMMPQLEQAQLVWATVQQVLAMALQESAVWAPAELQALELALILQQVLAALAFAHALPQARPVELQA